jgi:MYXO-CTERM domain-containing protein
MLLLLALPAFATWSIAAVDPDTGEVGVAGATCGPMVWFIAGLAPGQGAVAAQYATWGKGRDAIVEALADGATPEEALDLGTDDDPHPELRQWGVVGFAGPAVALTGDDVEAPARTELGGTWSVQGNTLAGELVVDAASIAMLETEGDPLAERLLTALERGAAEGGDARCDPADAAKSAFLYVALPDDAPHEPAVEIRASGAGAVAKVRAAFDEGRMSCAVTPGAPPAAVLLAIGVLLAGRRRGIT